MKERYDSLTSAIKESSVVEPSVIPPATGRRVSIPEVFNSPSPQTTPNTSPSHKPPTNGVVERPVARESPVPSPRNRRKMPESSPVPSPKTARKARRRKESGGETETPPKPQLPPRPRATEVGNGQAANL